MCLPENADAFRIEFDFRKYFILFMLFKRGKICFEINKSYQNKIFRLDFLFRRDCLLFVMNYHNFKKFHLNRCILCCNN